MSVFWIVTGIIFLMGSPVFLVLGSLLGDFSLTGMGVLLLLGSFLIYTLFKGSLKNSFV